MESPPSRPKPRWASMVTYGRRKDASAVETETVPKEQQSSSDAMIIGSVSPPSVRSSLENTTGTRITEKAFSKRSDNVGGGSSSIDPPTEDENDSSPAKVPFRFSWRDQLDQLNEEFDQEDKEEALRPNVRGPAQALVTDDVEMGTSTPAGPSKSEVNIENIVPRARQPDVTSSLATDQGLSPAVLTSPSKSKSSRAANTVASASEEESDVEVEALVKLPRAQRAVTKRLVQSESESDNENQPSKRKSSKAIRSSTSPGPSPRADRIFDSPFNQGEQRTSSPPSSPPEEGDVEGHAKVSPASRKRKSRKSSSATQEPEDGKPRREKVKAMSKKQLAEMEFETARLRYEHEGVHLPEPQENRRSLSTLFTIFQTKASLVLPSRPKPEPSSDPIVTSSQGPGDLRSNTPPSTVGANASLERKVLGSVASARSAGTLPTLSTTAKGKEKMPIPPIDDEDLPDIDDMSREIAEKRRKEEEAERMKQLHAYKLQCIKEQQVTKGKAPALVVESDDELEIEEDTGLTRQSKPKGIIRNSLGTPRRGNPLQVSMALASGRPSFSATDSQIVRAAKTDVFGLSRPVAVPKGSKTSKSKARKGPPRIGQDAFLNHLQVQSAKSAAEIREAKEQEWVAKGGKSGRARQLQHHFEKDLSEDQREKWLKKGFETAEAAEAAYYSYEEGEEEEEDGDWKPETAEESAARTSDDEDKENHVPAVQSSSHSRLSSVSLGAEDKENEVIEDKENVPPPPRSCASRLQDDDDLFPPTRQSSTSPDDMDAEDKENAPPASQPVSLVASNEIDEDEGFAHRSLHSRRPALRRIVDDDEEEAGDTDPNDENVPPARSTGLVFDADSDDELPPRPGGLLFGGAGGKALFNSSQESLALGDAFNMANADAEEEGDGFTQLFGLDTKPAAFEALRRRDPLESMDLESQKLLPAMDISTQDMRRDDVIFEEDQNVRAAIEREERQKTMAPKMYFNEDGFFTQTKPATQALPLAFPASTQNVGFGDPISFTLIGLDPGTQDDDHDVMDEDLEDSRPLKRLRRGPVEPSDESPTATLQPSPRRPKDLPKDAFAEMKATAAKKFSKKPLDQEKKKLIKEAFVEGEAHESDEDVVFGFTGAKEDDEEDDEANDKHVEGLVNDSHMDASEENAKAVLEKFAEHKQIDDAEAERIHKLAAEGKLRGKKRDRGVGFGDGSDSEEDDEENRRRRRAMHKRRRGYKADTLEQLGKNERTLAFYETYQAGVASDEENEFGLIPSSDAVEPEGDTQDEEHEGEDDEDVEETQPEKRIITTSDLHRQLKEAIANGTAVQSIDPNDLDWVDAHQASDGIDVELELNVKEVAVGRQASYRKFGERIGDEEALKESHRLKSLGKFTGKARQRRDEKSSGVHTVNARAAVTAHASKSRASSTSASSAKSVKVAKQSGKSGPSALSRLNGTKKDCFAS
ncbi:hypothetical protein FRB99_003677 [Tulasnella sp. 403]|nr:hypothetical protein FRB99_003677 [Tulasnella sp. 403]